MKRRNSFFARVGFKKATMEVIARDANVATGTIYKYFVNKDALFYTIISDAFVADFSRLTRRRILEFAQPEGLQPESPALDGASGELLAILGTQPLEGHYPPGPVRRGQV